MFILSIGSDILFAVWQAIRGLIGVIVAALYGYIVDLYNVFMVISRINILDDDYIKAIYNRVGMILGLFMLFKLSFSLIQSLIDPDKFTDKKNGFASIIYRSVIAIVLLGITPSIFKFARNFQNLIVGADDSSNNVLYRVVVADDIVYPVSSFGQRLATDLFFSFFREDDNRHYDEGLEVREIDGEPFLVVKNYATLKEDSYNGKISFDELVPYLSLKDAGQYVFKWDIILSVAVGVAVLWILVNYCISIATRVIQLAYLQLVAPVPILSYIGNPDGAFKKWINQCTKTYLDLFIRLIILYFIITLSGKALRFFEDANALSNYGIESDSMKFILVKVFLLLGLLMFGKRVPELIKELFPGDGKFDFGVKSPRKLFNDIPGLRQAYGITRGAATLGTGMAVGGVAGMAAGLRYGEGIRGKLAGMGGGLFRGAASARVRGNVFTNARNGINNVRAANERAYERHHDGSTFWGRMAPNHAHRVHEQYERELHFNDDYQNVHNEVRNLLDREANVVAAQDNLQSIRNDGILRYDLRERDARGRMITIARAGENVANVLSSRRNVNGSVVDINRIMRAANDTIDRERRNSLGTIIASGSTRTDGNATRVRNAIANEEVLRQRGVDSGFEGFNHTDSLTTGSLNDRLNAWESNTRTIRNRTNDIRGAAGGENQRYTQSGANANYRNRNGNH